MNNGKSVKAPEEQYKLRDQLLILFLICCSGFPTFIFTLNYSLSILFICLATYFLYTKQKVDKYFTFTALLILIISAAHFLQFEVFSLESFLSFFIIFASAYFAIKIYRIKFIYIYVHLMLVLTVISFFFYFTLLFFPSIPEFLIDKISPIFQVETGTFFQHSPTILIYNFNFESLGLSTYRNSGPFWEPGAFGGFLILAILFNLFIERKLFTKRSIIFIIGIVTTFSTTSYIALSLIIISNMLLKANAVTRFVLIPLIFLAILYSYNNIPFLGEKIALQITDVSSNSFDYQQRTRFVSALLDLYDFYEHPVWGKGKSETTRFSNYAGYAGELKHRNNGITDFLAQYGGVGFLFFFGFLLLSFVKLSKHYLNQPYYAMYILLVILTIGFSEKYFSRPVFACLPFMFLIFEESRTKLKNLGLPGAFNL